MSIKNEFFLNTPFFVMFKVFFWYGQSLIALAFLISTIVKTENQACNCAYAVSLFCIIINAAFAYAMIILKLLYSKKSMQNFGILCLKLFLYTIPTFNYSLAYGSIALTSAPNFDLNSMTWTAGRKFLSEDYNQDIHLVLMMFN